MYTVINIHYDITSKSKIFFLNYLNINIQNNYYEINISDVYIYFFIMMIFNETLKIRLKIFQHEDLIFI